MRLMFEVYGEDPEFIFNEVRKLGCRYVEIDGGQAADRVDLDRGRFPRRVARRSQADSAIVDRLVLVPGVEKQLKAGHRTCAPRRGQR